MTVIWSAVAGGFLGTLALTTIVRAASEFGLTRMDLPLLLGTALTENRRKARAIGYFDEGYAAAQLWKSDWDDAGGAQICQHADAILREIELLKS